MTDVSLDLRDRRWEEILDLLEEGRCDEVKGIVNEVDKKIAGVYLEAVKYLNLPPSLIPAAEKCLGGRKKVEIRVDILLSEPLDSDGTCEICEEELSTVTVTGFKSADDAIKFLRDRVIGSRVNWPAMAVAGSIDKDKFSEYTGDTEEYVIKGLPSFAAIIVDLVYYASLTGPNGAFTLSVYGILSREARSLDEIPRVAGEIEQIVGEVGEYELVLSPY